MSKKDQLTLTTQTKLNLGEKEAAFLNAYASVFCGYKRRYLALHQRGDLVGLKRGEIRSLVCGTDLAFRQFRGIETSVKGMIDSRKSNVKNYITTTESKIKGREKRLKKSINRLKSPYPNDNLSELSFKVYQEQRGINILKDKLNSLKNDSPSFCFGGKKLLRERHELTTAKDISNWKERWTEARNDEIVITGSHEESYRNQNCQFVPQDDGTFIANISVPQALKSQFGNVVQFPVELRYYHDEVLSLLVNGGAPLTYRFKRKNGTWYVFINFRVAEVESVTWRSQGALGVDLNADHLALTQITADGNLKNKWTVKLPLRGKTTEQRNDIIGHAIKKCTDIALQHQIPIVIEDLDFTKKKKALDKTHPEQARMLSALAYGRVRQGFISRCARLGIELIKVNPAYTSKLGGIKYESRYGLSRHHSAAMVIARRGLGFKESCPKRILQLNNGSVYLHQSQDLISGGLDKQGKVVVNTVKRALKARDGYVLNTEGALSVLADNRISVARLSNVLLHHAHGGSGSKYQAFMTKLRIEQKQSDQV